MLRVRHSAKGSTLIETLVAVGIMGVIAYFLVGLLKTGTLGQRTLQSQDDARTLTDQMAHILSDPIACQNTFGGTAGMPAADPAVGTPPITDIMDGNTPAVSQFHVGKNYGSRNLQLNKITIGGNGPPDPKTGIALWAPAPASQASRGNQLGGNPSGLGAVVSPGTGTGSTSTSGTAFVQVVWQQMGPADSKSGPSLLNRYFLVNVGNYSNNAIVDCQAQSSTGGGGSGSGSSAITQNPDGTATVKMGYKYQNSSQIPPVTTALNSYTQVCPAGSAVISANCWGGAPNAAYVAYAWTINPVTPNQIGCVAPNSSPSCQCNVICANMQ